MIALSDLPRVTEKGLELLAKLNINTVLDLLFYLPLRYQDRTKINRIAQLQAPCDAQIIARVVSARVVFGRRRMLTVSLRDDSGELQLRFFYFNKSQVEAFSEGRRVLCSGEARLVARKLEMVHPQYRVLAEDEEVILQQHLEPIYQLTKGLQQRRLQSMIQSALSWAQKNPEYFVDLLQEYAADRSPTLINDLLSLHQPSDSHESELLLNKQHPAQQRLIFDELVAHHLAFLQIRETAHKRKANPVQTDGRLAQEFERNLEYELTDAQQRVLAEIRQDLTASTPMMRLLQGDVGSGKTVVALLSSLEAAEKGYQTALMAPTELLAEQHYRYFSEELLPLGIQVVWLTSSLKRKQRNETLELIASGTAQVVVGTHALFQDEVQFQHLALCITDEQHRFGVHQRMTLSEKGLLDQCHPHQLIMTATPIPRTLAMSMYAHLDHSIIDQMPPGRQPIKTVAIADSRRAEVIERIRQACAAGAQVYWVCSLIEESETLRCQTATETYDNLCQQLHGFTVGLVHGRLPSQEKNQTMQDFAQQKVQVLVATTVIEVGVNVPNATLMVIENAERFGLAQLHQLRGRVGRGRQQSSCVLMYSSPLGDYAKKRIDALRKSTDGFKLAAIDLELRGPGEVLGTKQSGDVRLRMADLVRDANLLPEVQRCAQWLMREHPERIPLLAQRWLGKAADYARA